jgi:iron(III) transport system permease protein
LRTFPVSRLGIIGAAGTVFLITSVFPLIYLVGTLLGDVPLNALLLDARQRALLANTALLATATAALATLIGAPLGFGLARMALSRRAVVRIVLAAPVLLPPYVVALAWVYMGGSVGVAAGLIGWDIASWTYSLPAAAAVLALVYYPVVMLATEAALRQFDPHLEEAGLIAAGATPVLSRITLPLVAPAIAGAALIVFVLALAEFGVPALLRVRVYTTEIFTAFAALFDFARAAILTLPLLALAGAASAVAGALLRTRVIVAHRRASASSVVDLPSWHTAIRVLAALIICLAVALPVLVLAREADDLVTVAQGSWPSIRVSLILGLLGATLVVAVGGALGYARARASARVGRLVDIAWVVLFAVPSTVVGVALIGMWNRPGPMGAVYGTVAIVVLAYLARFVPVTALIVASSVRQIPDSQEEAAAVAGVRWLQSLRRVVVPQIARGLAAAWVIAFVFAFGELGASILVAPPGESTLPIRIYTIIANTPSSVVAALALLQVAVIAIPLIAGALYAAARAT